MNVDNTSKEFFKLLLEIVEGETQSNQLELFMEKIKSSFNRDELQIRDFLEQVFPDVICEEINEIINDSPWRSDEIGSNAVQDEMTLRSLYNVLCNIDQNCEIVFATNPYTPKDVIDELCDSDYQWEEDGTTSTLARNTTDEHLLRILSINKDSSTRYSVAANIHAPLDVLERLSTDEEFSFHKLYLAFDGGWHGENDINIGYVACSIKFAVINNLSTPMNIIKHIAEQKCNFDLEPNFSWLGIQASDVNQTIQSVASDILKTRANS